jgi:hypothetical protein
LLEECFQLVRVHQHQKSLPKTNYPFEFVRAANIQRCDLSASQRAAVAVFKAGPEERKIFEAIKEAAKERQGTRTDLGHSGNISGMLGADNRDQIGKRYNVNGRYISDLETVAQAVANLDNCSRL